LKQASETLDGGQRVVLAIDALDEADPTPSGCNPLYLPLILPHCCPN